jgi:hypothetical protein
MLQCLTRRGMVRVFVIALLCLTAPVCAQVVPAEPAYYANLHERVHDYVFRTYTDPVRIGWLLLDSAKDTWSKDPSGWGQNSDGYFYRVASGLGRRIVRNTLQLGFESVLQEDSRFRPSHEHGLRKRVWFALSHSVLSYRPDGSTQLAYGRIAAGVSAAAVSSTWHPQSVGAITLLSGMGQSALDRAGNNLLTEFQPDLTHFGKRTWKAFMRK